MSDISWTWSERQHPDVMGVFSTPATAHEWCDRLQSAPQDAIVGKILCVCAATAIAQQVLAGLPENIPQAADALELLGRWIDDPTEERFNHICSLIFDEGSPEFDPHGVVWWTLRTATSSAHAHEAAWALKSVWDAALEARFNSEHLRSIVQEQLTSRLHPESHV